MKKTLKFLGVAAGTAAFALSLSACGKTAKTTTAAAETTTETTVVPTTTVEPQQTTTDLGPTEEEKKAAYYENLNAGLAKAFAPGLTVNVTLADVTATVTVTDALVSEDADGNTTVDGTLTLEAIKSQDSGTAYKRTISVPFTVRDGKFTINCASSYLKKTADATTYKVVDQSEATTVMPFAYFEDSIVAAIAEPIANDVNMNIDVVMGYVKSALREAYGVAMDDTEVSLDVEALFESLKVVSANGVNTYSLDYDAICNEIKAEVEETFAVLKMSLNDMLLAATDNAVSMDDIAADLVLLKDQTVSSALSYIKTKTGYSLTEILDMISDYANETLIPALEDVLPEDVYAMVSPYTEDFDLDALLLSLLQDETSAYKTTEAYIEGTYGTVNIGLTLVSVVEAATEMNDAALKAALGQVVTMTNAEAVAEDDTVLDIVSKIVSAVKDVKPFETLYGMLMDAEEEEVMSLADDGSEEEGNEPEDDEDPEDDEEVEPSTLEYVKAMFQMVFAPCADYEAACKMAEDVITAVATEIAQDFTFTVSVKEDGTPVSVNAGFVLDAKDAVLTFADAYNKNVTEESLKFPVEMAESVNVVINASVSADYTTTTTDYDYEKLSENAPVLPFTEADYQNLFKEFCEPDADDTLTVVMNEDGTVTATHRDFNSYIDKVTDGDETVYETWYSATDYVYVFNGYLTYQADDDEDSVCYTVTVLELHNHYRNSQDAADLEISYSCDSSMEYFEVIIPVVDGKFTYNADGTLIFTVE